MTADAPEVRQLTASDDATVAALARVMAEAFNTRDDLMYRALYSSVPEVDAFNLARCKGRVHDALTTKIVYAIEVDGELAAFATVFPPGVHSTKPTQNPYTAELDARTPPGIVPVQNHFHDAIDGFERRAFGTDTYYVCFLVTAERARRRGLGARLLAHVVDMARKEGRLTSLTTATESNIAYYEKLGFARVAEERLLVNGAEVPLWAFTKA